MKDNSQPLVSVVMGTYNGSRWIVRAIDSILNQSYSNLELIICDDASIDNTLQLITKRASKDRRLIIVRNEINSGLNISLNKCIDVAQGKYIARMDDDDISLPNRLELQVNFLENHPEYVLVGCGMRFFDEDGIWGQRIAKTCPTTADIFKSRAFSHPTVMMRHKALAEVGYYSTDKLNRRGQDYDLWCKFYCAGYKGSNLPEPLLDYYESKSSIARRKLKFRIDHIRKQLLWRQRLGLPLYFLLFPLLDSLKCIVPKALYRAIRIQKYK